MTTRACERRVCWAGGWRACFEAFLLPVLLVSALIGGAIPACADGKLFLSYPQARVVTPSQRAVISWADHRERLIVETSLTPPAPEAAASGTDLAWILPLPAVPDQVEPASAGLLEAFQHLCRPEIIDSIEPVWQGILFLAFTFLCAKVVWNAVMRKDMIVSLLAVGIWIGTVLYLVANAQTVTSLFMTIDQQLSSAVTVHDRREIGSFDTAVISSEDPSALAAWLASQSFHVPPAILPAVASYVNDEWVFFAARFRSPRPGEILAPHPLSFSFPASAPIYPMRLTGVENGTCSIDLYVLGSQTAEADHFKVTYSQPQDEPEYTWMGLRWNGSKVSRGLENYLAMKRVPVASYQRVCASFTWLTKLSASLTENEMQEDVRIRFTAPRRHIPVAWSRTAALHHTLNWTIPFLIVLLLINTLLEGSGKGILVCLAVAALYGALTYADLPVTDQIDRVRIGIFDTLPPPGSAH